MKRLIIPLASISAAILAPSGAGASTTPREVGVEVPTAIEGGQFVVEGSIDGHRLAFILDSGAGTNVITPEAARLLGLDPGAQVAAKGVGNGSATAVLTQVETLRVGPIEVHDQEFAILALPPISSHRGSALPISGLLGYEFLRHFVTRLDYDARTVRFSPPRTCATGASANSIPFRLVDKVPEVDASLDGFAGRWSIDTGALSELTVFGPFAERHRIGQSASAERAAVGGVGGKVHARSFQAETFAIGGHALERPHVRIVHATGGAFATEESAGNIGSNTLANFIVTLDYPCQRLLLERGAGFGKPELINRAGFSITKRAADGPIQVLDVWTDGAAAMSGLKPGDVLVALDGVPVDQLSYGRLKESLAGGGARTLKVRFSRKDRLHEVEIELETA